MDVSIIIVNYNTKQMTLNCINSIFKHTKNISFEVLLVDNDSIDGSIELFKEDTRIQFISSGGNIGFGRANNLGYQNAKGKYIFLLNSDTILLNNAIEIFYNKMESLSQNVACMGTILKDNELKDIHSYGEFPTLTKEFIYRTVIRRVLKIQYYDNPSRRKDYDFEVPYITGADLFIRREAIERCGLFDKDFFMYYEETDLQFRFKKEGYTRMIIYGPSIIHLCGGSRKKVKLNLGRRIMSLRSSFIYLRKHNNVITYRLYRVLFALYNIPMLFVKKYSYDDRINYYKELLK